MKYKATYTTINEEGAKRQYYAQIEFFKHANDYGNGYGMYVKSDVEPFGGTAYDLRYNAGFNPDMPISFIVKFFEKRFSVKNGTLKLADIYVVKDNELPES